MSTKHKLHLFTMQRDRTIAGRTGHSIEFKKGEPTHVPPSMWAEVQAAGAIPVDELPEDKKPESKEPNDTVKRKELIFAAFEKLVLANDRESFTGTGVPHAKALEKELEFKIDSKERDALWVEFQQKDAD